MDHFQPGLGQMELMPEKQQAGSWIWDLAVSCRCANGHPGREQGWCRGGPG